MKPSALLVLCPFVLTLAACDSAKPKDPPSPQPPTLAERAGTTVAQAQQSASDARAALGKKLDDWNLTASEIKSDLEKTGRIVRKRTLSAGERVGGALDNARVGAVIKGKFIADKDLSALDIEVDADKGVVTLTGSVASAELVGRAIALALDTEGVTEVVSLVAVSADPTDTSSDSEAN